MYPSMPHFSPQLFFTSQKSWKSKFISCHCSKENNENKLLKGRLSKRKARTSKPCSFRSPAFLFRSQQPEHRDQAWFDNRYIGYPLFFKILTWKPNPPGARAFMIMVDALLVEVEGRFAGIDGHRDWSHCADSLLQILGKRTKIKSINETWCCEHCSYLIDFSFENFLLLTASDLWGMSTHEVRLAPELVALYKHVLPEKKI